VTEKKQKQNSEIFKKLEQQKGDIKSQIAWVVRHLLTYYLYKNLGTYNDLLASCNITAEEIKGERNGEAIHGVVNFAINDEAAQGRNTFKACLFAKHAGVNVIQQHFEKSKEQMKNNRTRAVLKDTIELAIHTSNNEREFKVQLTEQNIHTVIRRNESGRIY